MAGMSTHTLTATTHPYSFRFPLLLSHAFITMYLDIGRVLFWAAPLLADERGRGNSGMFLESSLFSS